jgi:hypothetical protein
VNIIIIIILLLYDIITNLYNDVIIIIIIIIHSNRDSFGGSRLLCKSEFYLGSSVSWMTRHDLLYPDFNINATMNNNINKKLHAQLANNAANANTNTNNPTTVLSTTTSGAVPLLTVIPTHMTIAPALNPFSSSNHLNSNQSSSSSLSILRDYNSQYHQYRMTYTTTNSSGSTGVGVGGTSTTNNNNNNVSSSFRAFHNITGAFDKKLSNFPLQQFGVRMLKQCAASITKLCTVLATQDGSIQLLIPIEEKLFQRLLLLEQIMNVLLPTTLALNPKEYRILHPYNAYRPKAYYQSYLRNALSAALSNNSNSGSGPTTTNNNNNNNRNVQHPYLTKKTIIDACSLFRYLTLEYQIQEEIAQMIGSHAILLRENLREIEYITRFY